MEADIRTVLLSTVKPTGPLLMSTALLMMDNLSNVSHFDDVGMLTPSINTCAGTLPVNIPVPYSGPGLHSLVLVITYSDGQSDYVVFPYFIQAGMEYVCMHL